MSTTAKNNPTTGRSTVSSNPYLKKREVKASGGVSIGAELKRLFGGLRSPLTLLLVFVPLVLSLAGGLDYASSWYYRFLHKVPDGAVDKRDHIFFLQCALHDSAYQQICKGSNLPAWSTAHDMQFWPFVPVQDGRWFGLAKFLGQPNPFWYIGLLVLAFMSFIAIGNPRFKEAGAILADAFGFGGGSSRKEKEAEQTAKKAALPESVEGDPDQSWLLGVVVEREWEPDPGYFYMNIPTVPSAMTMTDKKKKDKAASNRSLAATLQSYWLTANMLRTNLLTVAPPGSGKTSSIYRPLIDYVRRIGGAAIFFDSKGRDFDREQFDYNFEPLHPETSIRLNIFAGATPEQAGERLGEALIPNLSDDKRYFSDVAKDAMAALVGCFHAVYNRFPELTELVLYLNEPLNLENLYKAVQDKAAKADNSDRTELLRIASGLKRIAMLAQGKNDALGNLITALTPLTATSITRVLVCNPAPDGETYTIEQLLRQPGLIRLSLPVADYPRIAPIIGRLILAQFNFAVLSPDCNTSILKLAAVDEAHNFITGSIAKGMAQARSNNAGFLLALQTLSQIENKSLLDTIFAASGTKLVLAGVSDEDAERFSKTFGEIELPYVTYSESTNKGTNKGKSYNNSSASQFEMFSGGGGGSERGSRSSISQGTSTGTNVSSGLSSNHQTRQRRRFLPSEVRELPTRFAIIESSNAYGQRWFAQVINMDGGLVNALATDLKTVWVEAEKAKEKKDNKGKGKEAVATQEGNKDSQTPSPANTATNSQPTTTTTTVLRPAVKFSFGGNGNGGGNGQQNTATNVVNNNATPTAAAPTEPEVAAQPPQQPVISSTPVPAPTTAIEQPQQQQQSQGQQQEVKKFVELKGNCFYCKSDAETDDTGPLVKFDNGSNWYYHPKCDPMKQAPTQPTTPATNSSGSTNAIEAQHNPTQPETGLGLPVVVSQPNTNGGAINWPVAPSPDSRQVETSSGNGPVWSNAVSSGRSRSKETGAGAGAGFFGSNNNNFSGNTKIAAVGDDDYYAEIARLLADPKEGDVQPEQVEHLIAIIRLKKRTIEDVRRVIEYVKAQPGVKHRGNYITRIIRADDYPTPKQQSSSTIY